LGGIIPRNVKVKVIRHWLDGLTRERIANKVDIGDGSVTGIIEEARKEEEYNDLDLLRETAVRLKKEGVGLPSLAFAIRLQRIMEEHGINEGQLESLIQDCATCCLRNQMPYDTVIKIGREVLYLEQKFGFPVEKIPEIITQGKQTIDRLEKQRLEILMQKRQASEECAAKRQEHDILAAKLEKYLKEIPSIQRIIELESKLEETGKMNALYENHERALTKERDAAWRESMRLSAEVIELDARNKELEHQLSRCRSSTTSVLD
jgi:hypothetical protein